jgi:hypothetical protein
MPALLDLPKADRKEKTRTIARLVYAAMEPCTDDNSKDSTVNARFYQGMAEWGMAEDQEFYGDAFSPERQKLIDEFEVFFKEGQAYAAMYDDCIVQVERAAPHFAVASHSLLRMWCVAHFWKVLAKDDGPFANLQVVAGNGMDEGDEEQEGSEEGSSEEEEVDDDDDDDGTSSEENDSEQGSGSGSSSGEDEDGDDDDELTQAEKKLEQMRKEEDEKKKKKKKKKKQRVE